MLKEKRTINFPFEKTKASRPTNKKQTFSKYMYK